jgi:hypothetical protein
MGTFNASLFQAALDPVDHGLENSIDRSGNNQAALAEPTSDLTGFFKPAPAKTNFGRLVVRKRFHKLALLRGR